MSDQDTNTQLPSTRPLSNDGDAADGSSTPPGRLLVLAGAGLLGSRLADLAERAGWRVRILHRSDKASPSGESVRTDESGREHADWAPAATVLDPELLSGADAVVCLSGAPIAPQPWTPARRRELVASRLSTTVTLSRAIAQVSPSVRPTVLLTGSAVGYYGSRGGEVLTEDSKRGEGFLAELCRRWEAVPRELDRLAVRTVQSRTGLIVAREGGIGAILDRVYRAGLGARLGDGEQWMSLVGLSDAAAGLLWALEHDDVTGPINLVAPEPVRNRELHALLASSTPSLSPLAVPGPLLHAASPATGGMVGELLLASQRALPQALESSGFRFTAADAAAIWTAELGRTA